MNSNKMQQMNLSTNINRVTDVENKLMLTGVIEGRDKLKDWD